MTTQPKWNRGATDDHPINPFDVVFSESVSFIYFLKLKKIYITDFHLIFMNNHCDKLCQVYQVTCHFALLL